jgi:hypothetical protein
MSAQPFRSFRRISVLAAALAIAAAAPAAHAAPHPPPVDIFANLADEVAGKMLASPAFQAKEDGGRKVKIVIGDVRNNSNSEDVRVDDIFNDIRNQIVNAGTTRLFAPGELSVDFIISPELTSRVLMDRGRPVTCFTLQLSLSTPSGEFVAAHSAKSC